MSSYAHVPDNDIIASYIICYICQKQESRLVSSARSVLHFIQLCDELHAEHQPQETYYKLEVATWEKVDRRYQRKHKKHVPSGRH